MTSLFSRFVHYVLECVWKMLYARCASQFFRHALVPQDSLR